MKELRTYYLITQKQMSEILKTSRSTYAGWENGIDPVSLTKLNDFCNYFNVSLDYICGISSEKNYKNMKKEIDTNEIGKRMNLIRLKNNDTQNVVASILKVDQSNYSKYELGKINIPVEVLIKLSDFYDVSLDYLVGRSKIKKIADAD